MHDVLNVALTKNNLDAAGQKLVQQKLICPEDLLGMKIYRYACRLDATDQIETATYSPLCPWNGDRLPGDDECMTDYAAAQDLVIAQAFSSTCAQFLQQNERNESRFINRIFSSSNPSVGSDNDVLRAAVSSAHDVGFEEMYFVEFRPVFTLENEKILVLRFQEEFGEDATLSHMVQGYLNTGVMKNGLKQFSPVDNLYYNILNPVFSAVYLAKLQREMVHAGYYVIQHPGMLMFLSHEAQHKSPQSKIFWAQDQILNELALKVKDDAIYYTKTAAWR